MPIKHNKQIKKLSTAIRRGKQIADEAGIKQTREGAWFIPSRDKSKISCACAMGMALIGKLGVEVCTEIVIEGRTSVGRLIRQNFPAVELPNPCLAKATREKGRNMTAGYYSSVDGLVMFLNDKTTMPVEKIAETLESCNL